jgi:hypothetical protein
MDAFDRFALLAELEHEICGLNHGPQEKGLIHQAHDYLVLPVGLQAQQPEGEEKDKELLIPVCLECLAALSGEEWTLLYCFDCGESRWVWREIAKNSYRHHILWLQGCPECSDKFGGLYFSDELEGAEDHILVPQKIRNAA